MDTTETQKRIYNNKVNKGFNIDNIEIEFCCLYGEVSEAYDAFKKKEENLGSELADVAIFLLGLSEILNINLGEEISKKMLINERRTYKVVDGVTIKTEE